jgi:tetratricopeptide (TPR) repeat protein
VPVLAQGTVLDGRYRILRHLGSGGMASVLLCRDERLDRLVAVKRLHADQPEDVCRRFLREAKLGASLNHPNLVSVFDTATDDEGVLIVMEYVEGEALSRVLRRGPLAPDRVGRMAGELGSALDHAHERGVVHRDVKPGNVLLRNDGVTKLADLGIATAASHTRITRTGSLLGTAAYMAPEQLEGHEAGPAADIYALAVVCFEALTGEPAHRGRTPMEIAAQISSEPLPDLRERWPHAPYAVAALLRRAMARDPRDRPATAEELGDGLRRVLEGAPGLATAITRPLEHPAAETRRGEPRAAHHATEAAESGARPTPSAAAAVERPMRGPARAGRRSRLVALGLAAALLAVVVAAIAIALGSGDDDAPSSAGGGPRDQRAQQREQPGKQEQKAEEPEVQQPAPQPVQPAPEEEPAAPAPAPGEEDGEEEPSEQQQPSGSGPAQGAALNEQGFALMGQGRYDEAIPILQRAVDSFPPGTTDLNYAYALFNLGRSLRLAGRPDEAVPILEQRLAIPNQRGVVRRELELAQQEAGLR